MDLTREFKHMAQALFVAYKALLFGETPVACVVVDDRTNRVVLIGYNYTNVSLNGSKHAEFIALERLPRDSLGRLMKEYTLFVTVEPCIMCASYLRQLGVTRVVYGAGNDRFGGNGTVLAIHSSDLPCSNYPSYGGICRTEGIQLLRNFYVQENSLAPIPQVKRNKNIDSKLFPKSNIAFDDKFDQFYGPERQILKEDRGVECTPQLHKGYSLTDLLSAEEVRMPFIEEELGDIDSDQLRDFFDLFWDVNDDGKVNYSKVVRVFNTRKRALEI